MVHGSCLCGAVSFEIDGDLVPPSACHCSLCCKQTGHVWASTHVPETSLTLTAQDGLRWFRASATAKRGFCGNCGSFLFWKHDEEDRISVSMGAIEPPTNQTLSRHIFVADKGDYYQIGDDLPQWEAS